MSYRYQIIDNFIELSITQLSIYTLILVARWWVAHGPPQAKLGPRATPWPQLGFGPCTGKNAVQLPKNPATRAVLAGPSS